MAAQSFAKNAQFSRIAAQREQEEFLVLHSMVLSHDTVRF
jgi:hypothetical protein